MTAASRAQRKKKSREKIEFPLFIISDMDGTLTRGDLSIEVLYEWGRQVGQREAKKRGFEGEEARRHVEEKGKEFAHRLERNWDVVDRGPVSKRPDYYAGMAVEKTFAELIKEGYRIKRDELTRIAYDIVSSPHREAGLMPRAKVLFDMIQASRFSERRMCYILTANAKPIAKAVALKLGFTDSLAEMNVYGFDFECDAEGYITGVKDYWKNSKVSNNKKIETNMWRRLRERKGLGERWARKHGIARKNVARVSLYLEDSVTGTPVAKDREKKGAINIFVNISKRLPRTVPEYTIATSRLDVLFQYFSVFARGGPEALARLVSGKIRRRTRFPVFYGAGKEHVFKTREDARAGDRRSLNKLGSVVRIHREIAAAASRRERAAKQARAAGRIIERNLPDAPAMLARNAAKPFRWISRQARNLRERHGRK